MSTKSLFSLLTAVTLSILFTACSSSSTANLSENEKESLHQKRIYELQRVKERLSKQY